LFIPDDKISDIRAAADIFDIISESVLLKKAGKNYTGLCPFHAEKTPSFTVNPDKQIFYCFGCGTGGDVFAFLRLHDNLSFPQAVRMLASRYGIEIPTRQMTPEQKRQMDEREGLQDVNKEAMAYFQSALYSDSGQNAREYLRQRNIGQETIERFQLGYAPDGWDNLLRHLNLRRISSALAEKSGLIVPRSGKSGFYDRFRNRIIFPISDLRMQVIGFGGRVMDDSLPKYLNSPETPLYDKRRSLYGLHLAKSDCRTTDHVYIAEGYIDVLALHQHGIKNAVATLGTALSREHLRLLKGYASKITLVYDSDEAGIKAAQRSIDIFGKEHIEARILILPSGHDPDSFLSEFGAEAFFAEAEKARSMMEFLLDRAVERHGLSPEGKSAVLSEMKGHIALVEDDVARRLHIKILAERIGINEEMIWKELYKDSSTPVLYRTEQIRKENLLERRMIAMMLGFPDILSNVREQQLLEIFEDARLKTIGQIILNTPNYSGDISEIIGRIEDPEDRKLTISLAMEEENWNYEGCLKLISQFNAGPGRRNKHTLLNEIKKAEAGKDDKLLFELLRQKQQEAKLYVKNIGHSAERRGSD
jgi:DNA primase